MKYSLSLLSRQSSSLFMLASFFLSVCLSLNKTAVLTSLSMNFHEVFWRSRPWVRNSPLHFGIIWIQNFFMGTSNTTLLYCHLQLCGVLSSCDCFVCSQQNGNRKRLQRNTAEHLVITSHYVLDLHLEMTVDLCLLSFLKFRIRYCSISYCHCFWTYIYLPHGVLKMFFALHNSKNWPVLVENFIQYCDMNVSSFLHVWK